MEQSTTQTYPNQDYHNYLKSLMRDKKILEMFFNIDRYGMQTFRIKAQGVQPFEYQLNYDGFIWIMNYLSHGYANDNEVDCLNPLDTEGESLDSIQKGMFKMMIEHQWGEVQQVGNLYDSKGRIKLYLNFNFGIIHFFMEKDEDIIKFMKNNNLKV